MNDLISRSDVNDVIDELEVYTCGRPNTMKVEVSVLQLQRFINKLKNIPTAYSVDKVVEELERLADGNYKSYCIAFNSDDRAEYDAYTNAIEIVKQGGVRNNRKDCEYRHDNGNCLKVGGFCTAVDNKHCEKLKHGGVADDVCEWKVKSNYYVTKCSHDTDIMYGLKQDFKFCPYCSKKIKVVQ